MPDPTTPDYYAVLGVAPTADRGQIVRAWRGLVRAYHPDLHEGNALRHLAQAKVAAANEAYEVLSDPRRRAAYDARRRSPASPWEREDAATRSGGWSGGKSERPPAADPLGDPARRLLRALLPFLLLPAAVWLLIRFLRAPRTVAFVLALVVLFWVLPRWLRGRGPRPRS